MSTAMIDAKLPTSGDKLMASWEAKALFEMLTEGDPDSVSYSDWEKGFEDFDNRFGGEDSFERRHSYREPEIDINKQLADQWDRTFPEEIREEYKELDVTCHAILHAYKLIQEGIIELDWERRRIIDLLGDAIDIAPAADNSDVLIYGNNGPCLERKGSMGFSGDSGIGKSTLVMQLAVMMAAGKPLFGQFNVKEPLPVMIIQSEDNDRQIARCLNDICKVYGIDPESIRGMITIRKVDGCLTGRRFFRQLDAWAGVKKPALIIINPVSAVFEGDVSSSKDATTFLKRGLHPVLDKHNCGALIVTGQRKTYFKKNNGKTVTNSIIGSVEWYYDQRCVWGLYKVRDKDYRLCIEKREEDLNLLDDEGNQSVNISISHHEDGVLCWMGGDVLPSINSATTTTTTEKTEEKMSHDAVWAILNEVGTIGKNDLVKLLNDKTRTGWLGDGLAKARIKDLIKSVRILEEKRFRSEGRAEIMVTAIEGAPLAA
ncbi:AAA family ATPase [Verrucomicrobia bacterium]|nr:AAA family ATPase [Verrucomicrobiota bacterium]